MFFFHILGISSSQLTIFQRGSSSFKAPKSVGDLMPKGDLLEIFGDLWTLRQELGLSENRLNP